MGYWEDAIELVVIGFDGCEVSLKGFDVSLLESEESGVLVDFTSKDIQSLLLISKIRMNM